MLITEGMGLLTRISNRITKQSGEVSLSLDKLGISASPLPSTSTSTPTFSLPPPPASAKYGQSLPPSGTSVNNNNNSSNDNSNKGEEPTEQLDFLFIDADSKDPSLGLTAPPKEFLTPQSLKTMYTVLRPGGMLALNVVARTSSLLDALVVTVKRVFAECEIEGGGGVVGGVKKSQIYLLKPSDETANTALIVVKGEKQDHTTDVSNSNGSNSGSSNTINSATTSNAANRKKQAPGLSKKVAVDVGTNKVAREIVIENWLKVRFMTFVFFYSYIIT